MKWNPKKISARVGGVLEGLGVVAAFGAYMAAYFAGVFESLDHATTAIENFPGGTLGKIAAGLGATAAGFITAGYYVKRH